MTGFVATTNNTYILIVAIAFLLMDPAYPGNILGRVRLFFDPSDCTRHDSLVGLSLGPITVVGVAAWAGQHTPILLTNASPDHRGGATSEYL